MRRCLIAVAALALVAASATATAQDDRVVQIDTLNVRDVLYHLSGGGGNTLVLIDEINGGVVLIDTKRPGWGQAVLDVLGQVTDLPVTTIITTHANPDHAGSNGEFPDAVEIIAHENTATHLAAMEEYAGGRGLPNTTFVERHTLLDDLDRIELYYFGPAHTDGDIVVVFPEKRTAYLGDLFPDKATPVIDTARGGSGVAFPETLATAVAAIDGVDRVITGQGPFPSTYAGRGRREQGTDRAWTGWMTWDDLAEYAEFNRAFLEAVETAFRNGMSAEAAAAQLSLSDRFANYGMENAQANVEAIYEELSR